MKKQPSRRRYFVVVNGEHVADNVWLPTAKKVAKAAIDKGAETCYVSIGTRKRVKGEWVYTNSPASFYLAD